MPEGAGPCPGVVVIHEIYGLNQNIRDICDRFAAAGYAALAVDLFANRNRAVCMLRFMAGMLRGKPERFGVSDLRASLAELALMPRVDGERVGAIGFCMGGGFAIAWACTDPRLRVVAPFYGTNPRPLAAVARSCPVVGSYPEKDFTARAGRKLDAALAEHGVDHDIFVYPGARHSFFNEHGSAYDAAASEDAWRRTLSFFGRFLGDGAAEAAGGAQDGDHRQDADDQESPGHGGVVEVKEEGRAGRVHGVGEGVEGGDPA
jgi:carboxymethylenebutenolidase